MILDSTSKSIQALLGGAPAATQPTWYSAWADHDDIGPPPTFVPGDNAGSLNGVTPVTLVASPAGAQQRQVKYLTVHNADSAQVTVTFRETASAVQLFTAELEPGEYVIWEDDVGWGVFQDDGTVKAIASPLTTKGDIWGYDTGDNRIPVGADGEILVADSTQGLGVAWTATIPPLSFSVKTLTVLDDPYTILDADQFLLGDAVGGAITATLPTAVGRTGRMFRIKKIDATANAVTLEGFGAETIDAALNIVLGLTHETVTVISDGTEWWIV